MTRIASRRTKLRGERNAIVQGRPLVVIVEPHEIIVRLKGEEVRIRDSADCGVPDGRTIGRKRTAQAQSRGAEGME